MRTRWEVNWAAVSALAMMYFFAGLAVTLAVALSGHRLADGSHRHSVAFWVALVAWIGPYLVAALGWGMREIWLQGAVIERVRVPVTKDLRKTLDE